MSERRAFVAVPEPDVAVPAAVAASPGLRDEILALLYHPAVDRLVVCHGDACVPNTLLAPTGPGPRTSGPDGPAGRWWGRARRERAKEDG
jgi:hypothetical protein